MATSWEMPKGGQGREVKEYVGFIHGPKNLGIGSIVKECQSLYSDFMLFPRIATAMGFLLQTTMSWLLQAFAIWGLCWCHL